MMNTHPLSRLSSFLDAKIVGRSDLELEERARRKLYLFFVLLSIVPFVVFASIQMAKGYLRYSIPNYIMSAILVFMILVLRRMKRGKPIFRVTAGFAFTFFTYWTYTGAMYGNSALWTIALPPFLFFLLGKREGMIWSAAIFITSAAAFLHPFPWEPVFEYTGTFAARHLSTLLTVILFTYNYESTRNQYKNAMEAEQVELLRERDQLEKANRMLTHEIAEKERIREELEIHKSNLEELVSNRTEELIRKNLELQESEKRYRLLADNATDLIWAVDMDLRFIYLSPSVLPMYGYTVEEAMALPLEKYQTPASFEKMMKLAAENLLMEREERGDPDRSLIVYLEHMKKDGSVFPIEMKASFMRDEKRRAVGIVGINRDISERIRSEKEKEFIQAQLAESQKREAIGTLAGGLAHDFNNVLGGIMGSIDLVRLLLEKESLANREEVDFYLNLGAESSRRSANMIRQLLTLSKKHELRLAPLDITGSLKNIHSICRNSFPKSILLDFRVPEDQIVVMAESSHIEQVILNLCINASHAMTLMRAPHEQQGGSLTVEVSLPDREEAEVSGAPPGRHWIRIDVTDTGVGMDSETIGRIFEPFFTTKNDHGGTGLGLATSLSIVRQHSGIISAKSQPGRGSTFSVYLPSAVPGEASAEKVPGPSITHGRGTILVIDDEKFLLDVVSGLLKKCGYEVMTAETPARGIAAFREKHADITAVLLDLSMPEKSGIEVFQELREIDPGVKAVLASGMIDIETKNRALGMGIREIIHKPFSLSELSAVFAGVLSGKDTSRNPD